jgi:hypothetical protein
MVANISTQRTRRRGSVTLAINSLEEPRPVILDPVGPSKNNPREARAGIPEDVVDQMVASMTPSQRQAFYAAFPAKAIPKHTAPVRVGSSSVPARPHSGTKMRPSVVNPAQQVKDQQLVDGLHAVYGPKLDQNFPIAVKPKPVCLHTPKGVFYDGP